MLNVGAKNNNVLFAVRSVVAYFVFSATILFFLERDVIALMPT